MNINGIYIVPIYVKINSKNHGNNIFESNGKFLKFALVYKDKKSSIPTFIDLETKEKYCILDIKDALVGEIYISLKYGLYSLSDILEEEKANYPKRKILKIFNEIKGTKLKVEKE